MKRWLFVVSLFAASCGSEGTLPQESTIKTFSDAKDRAAFQKHFEAIAKVSKATPLTCEYKTMEGEPQTQQVTLQTKTKREDDPNGFSVSARSDQGLKFSTWVTYKHGLGTLDVISGREGRRTYRHTFNGFFDDVWTLTVKDDTVTEVSFVKYTPQRAVSARLLCET